MTMFTPVGVGGRRPGRRSAVRRVLAVLLVVALVGAAGAAAWWWFYGGGRASSTAPTVTPSASPQCRTPQPRPPKDLPKRADIKLEVLNGTQTSGLATSTADAFVLLGFDVVSFGNSSQPVRSGVGVVSYAKADLPSAVVVASYVPGATLRQVAKNTGGIVTLTLGSDYTQLATPAKARANVTKVALPTPAPVCR